MATDNFTVEIEFHGDIRPTQPNREQPPKGLYDVIVKKVSLDNPKVEGTSTKDETRKYIRLDMQIEGGDPATAKGLEMAAFLNLPNGKSADNDKFFEAQIKKALIAFGQPADAVVALAGKKKIGPGAFLNKKGTVHFIPAPDRNSYPQLTFLDAEETAKVKSGELRISDPQAKGGKQARGGTAPTPPAGGIDVGSLGGSGAAASGGNNVASTPSEAVSDFLS